MRLTMLLLLARQISYPDWLPALLLAVHLMVAAIVMFLVRCKPKDDGTWGRSGNAAMLVLLVLATIGVFAMLRQVM